MNNKNSFFYICWEDSSKKTHKIGMLAQIDNLYYLKMNTKENSAEAYNQGFIGIPGFLNDKIYRSEELFDFFKCRILERDKEKYCEKLKETSGKSMVDSFFVEQIPEELHDASKTILIEMFENQQQLEQSSLETYSL